MARPCGRRAIEICARVRRHLNEIIDSRGRRLLPRKAPPAASAADARGARLAPSPHHRLWQRHRGGACGYRFEPCRMKSVQR